MEKIFLTEWEIANFHLKPVSTLTFYEGKASVEIFKNRLKEILIANPWLTGRIKKDKKVSPYIAYNSSIEVESIINQHLKVVESESLSLSLDYNDIVRKTLKYQCTDSKKATNSDEVLFNIVLLPIENYKGDQPLQRYISNDGFVMLVNLNHTLGDGHTYYKIYQMLSEDVEITSLNPIRKEGFEEAKTEVIGKLENKMLSSFGLVFGILGGLIKSRITNPSPQNLFLYEVEKEWINTIKANSKTSENVDFISTNDALTSWFFNNVNSNVNLMVANLRSRNPSIVTLTDEDAGNYEANIPYFKEDVKTAALIRQSIQTPNREFRAKRAGGSKIPGFWTLLKNKVSIITNWATFYKDVRLKADDNNILKPKLHLPIMQADGMITSMWNSMVVFKLNEEKTGVLMITRRFDKDDFNESDNYGELPFHRQIV